MSHVVIHKNTSKNIKLAYLDCLLSFLCLHHGLRCTVCVRDPYSLVGEFLKPNYLFGSPSRGRFEHNLFWVQIHPSFFWAWAATSLSYK